VANAHQIHVGYQRHLTIKWQFGQARSYCEAQWVNAVKTEDETHLQSAGDGSHNLADNLFYPTGAQPRLGQVVVVLQIIPLAPLYSSLDFQKTHRGNTEMFLKTLSGQVFPDFLN
jgi:hypothetical protein